MKLDDSVTRKKAGGRRRTEAFTHAHRGFYTEKSLHKGAFYIQKVLHREVFTLRCFCRQASRSFYTQKFWHEEVFTQRAFYTQTRLHTEAFTQRSLYTEQLFTRRRFYTEKSFLWGAFHTNVLELLHTKAVTQRSLYTESFNTQTRLHTETFTRRSLYTEFLHTEAFTHTEIFTQTCFHPEKLLHKEAFTQRIFYTRKLLHTKAFTQRSLCTEAPLHEATSWNWQQFFRKTLRRSFRELTCSPKNRLFQQICSKKPKEYISEAGPHSVTFTPTLRWNGGPSGPAEPAMSVSSKILNPPNDKSKVHWILRIIPNETHFETITNMARSLVAIWIIQH